MLIWILFLAIGTIITLLGAVRSSHVRGNVFKGLSIGNTTQTYSDTSRVVPEPRKASLLDLVNLGIGIVLIVLGVVGNHRCALRRA